MEKTIEQLEQELIDMKAMHASQWATWGSELCAADLEREEEKLEKEIADAKRLKTLREEAIERWRMLGLLDRIDENLITITVTARKFGIDEIKK